MEKNEAKQSYEHKMKHSLGVDRQVPINQEGKTQVLYIIPASLEDGCRFSIFPERDIWVSTQK